MAVQNSIYRADQVGNGVTRDFNVPFYFLDPSHLKVLVTDTTSGIVTTLVLNSDYTVTGAGNFAGGYISTVALYSGTQKVSILRDVPYTQLTRYLPNDPFPAASHEAALDLLTMQNQQQSEVLSRVPTLPAETTAPGVTPTPTEGTVLGWVAGKWAWLSAATAQLAVNLLDATNVALGDALIAVKSALTGGVSRTQHDKNADALNAADFGALADGSDQTAKVQIAINALNPALGGVVTVNPGTKFNLKNLTFPKRATLVYLQDSDSSQSSTYVPRGTSEWVMFSSNANNDGIVNEQRVSAPFHPSYNVDVRKDVPGGDAWLGTGQKRIPDSTHPVRASMNIFDEGLDCLNILYQNYGIWSDFSGVTWGGWRRTVALEGIGTAQWTSVPAENTVITGLTSGAKGFLLSVSSTTTTVLWLSGKFIVGEKLTDDNETTTAVTTSATLTLTAFPMLQQDMKRGNWGVGMPAGALRDLFGVAGKIASQKSRAASWWSDKPVDNPAFILVDSYENATPNGFELTYDTTPAAASRRITLRKYATASAWVTGTAYVATDTREYRGTIYRCLINHTAGTFATDLAAGKWIADNYGHVGAVKAHTGFGNAGGTGDVSSYNVSGITHDSTGTYTITFKTPFARADYQVCLTTGNAMQYAIAFNKSTTALVVKVYTPGTTTLVDLVADLDVIVVGGDI